MKREHKKEVGARVKAFRIHLDMTQKEIAEFLDTGRANYSRIEIGHIYPGLFMLKNLQEKFGLNPNWIINKRGEMFLQDIEDARFSFGKDEPDVQDLLFYMEKVPAIKYTVLTHLSEYKARNQDIIQAAFKHPEVKKA